MRSLARPLRPIVGLGKSYCHVATAAAALNPTSFPPPPPRRPLARSFSYLVHNYDDSTTALPSSSNPLPVSVRPSDIDDAVPHLVKLPQHKLTLADLVIHGAPPLSRAALLKSAQFALSVLPIRLARRIEALRNLPYIVASNPNIRRIYDNYHHSLGTLLPWLRGDLSLHGDDAVRPGPGSPGEHAPPQDNLALFTSVLVDLIHTHTNTIPFLARGLLDCHRYMPAAAVARFVDAHLSSRIGTRLIAEQHIALYEQSTLLAPATEHEPEPEPEPSLRYIGVIDTALDPAAIVESCAALVADTCELQYGVRPECIVETPSTAQQRSQSRGPSSPPPPTPTIAFVPAHLEYIITELLKNAIRATVEHAQNTRSPRHPVIVTIAPEPLFSPSSSSTSPTQHPSPALTIRIRDRGGGIPPSLMPEIWGYSFTTFCDEGGDSAAASLPPPATANPATGMIGLAGGTGLMPGASSIAGLGYGLPLSRAYAECFGGGVTVQSLYGWGTDVYVRVEGLRAEELRGLRGGGVE